MSLSAADSQSRAAPGSRFRGRDRPAPVRRGSRSVRGTATFGTGQETAASVPPGVIEPAGFGISGYIARQVAVCLRFARTFSWTAGRISHSVIQPSDDGRA